MEVLVEHLDKVVDGLQVAQVVVVHVHADAEVQARVPTVDYLEVAELDARTTTEKGRKWGLDKQAGRVFCLSLPRRLYLDKVGVFGVAHRDQGVHLLDQLLLLVVVKVHVPFGQARLARTILDQDEANLKIGKL